MVIQKEHVVNVLLKNGRMGFADAAERLMDRARVNLLVEYAET